jgi:hypothetical protein
MGLPASSSDREKIVTELPEQLHEQLKARAGQFALEVQTAVEQAIAGWRELESIPATIDTAGPSRSRPSSQSDSGRNSGIAQQRRVSLVQGVAQSTCGWRPTAQRNYTGETRSSSAEPTGTFSSSGSAECGMHAITAAALGSFTTADIRSHNCRG